MEGQRKREGVGEEGESLSPYKGSEYRTPPYLPIPEELCQQNGWVTHTCVDENPIIRGHDLCFDKMCQ